MKFIKQTSTNDCGASCMAMICSQYKMKISLAKAREIALTDSQGNNFFSLINGFQSLGFEATAVKGDPEAFYQDSKFQQLQMFCLKTEPDTT